MSFSDQDKAKALDMAAGMADDFNQEEAAEFMGKHGGESWFDDFKLLFSMISHPDYSLSATTWAVIAGALAYVIFPVDVIPDFIPVLGWIDDGVVLSSVTLALSDEVDSFKNFLAEQTVGLA